MKRILFALLLFSGTAFAQEPELLAVLASNAPLPEKSEACLQLARVGTRQAVPMLANLLGDEHLSHRARSALEAIPDPTVEAALRSALDRLQGPLLVGVIHSLGMRQDAPAVVPLTRFLNGTDSTVAQAAAQALGRIGGPAIPILQAALPKASPAILPALSEGLLRGAEFLPSPQAIPLYDQLQALPNLPPHLRLAAFSGAIRCPGPQGVSLLLEAIRSGAPVPVPDAIQVSLGLAGTNVTHALIAAIPDLQEQTQIQLLQALGHRGDPTAAPALGTFARRGSVNRRVAAIQSLVQLGSAPSLPVLTELVKDRESSVADAAWSGLIGLPGQEADAEVESLLSESDPKTRVAAIEAAARRRISAAVPALLRLAKQTDSEVANAAFEALGQLGGAADIQGLVEALSDRRDPSAAETALTAISERQADPALCADQIVPGLSKAKGEAKLALVRVLGTLGGARALEAVRAAASDSESALRETAWRTLCDWPTSEALPDLARILRQTEDRKLRSLALRGQLRLIPLQTLTTAQRVAQIQEAMPIIEQLNEQRLALATLGQLPCPESLAIVLPYLSRTGFKEEASVAAVAIAEPIVSTNPAEVATAMRMISTHDEPLALRARKVLAQVPAGVIEDGFKSIFNGQDLTGWDGKPGAWKVEQGALTAESTPENPCKAPHYLVWRGGQPADFELIADFRLSAAGNSGIQLRSLALADWDTSGYQADMSGDGALVGFVYEHRRGLIAGRGERVLMSSEGKREVQRLADPDELLKVYRQEAWNTYRIICRGPEITLFINGKLMCQFTDRDPKHAAFRGVIALQMHPGPPMKIEFKNLRLKEL